MANQLGQLGLYRRLLGYLKPYWWAVLLVLAGYLLNAATEVSAARLMQYIIDAINQRDQTAKNWFPILVIMLFLFRGIGTFVGNYFIALVARNLVYTLRREVFERLLSLPAAYYLTHSGGQLASKLIYDVEQVTLAATDGGKTLIREGLIVSGLLGYLFYTNWRLSLSLLVIAPMVALLIRRASKRLRTLSHQIQDSMGAVNHIATEVISGVNMVKSHNGQAQERQRFEQASRANLRQSLRMVITTNLNTPLVQLLMATAMGAVIWLALQPDILGDTTAGEFVAYITAAGLLSKPMRALTEVNEKFQRGLAAAQSVFELIDTPAERDGGTLTPVLQGRIVFDGVSLRHEDGTLALDHIDLVIEPGETVALVGRSGAGKTSLISLLQRVYPPTTGTIRLDDIPLPDIRLDSLRRQMAIVSQQVVLFDDTIRHNIAYGELADASEQRIQQAARDAHADTFIQQLPQGYDTLVGSQGLKLSGGQRQRLAIARALLKPAPILILDEATSALDNESEHFVQMALQQAMQSRTVLVIAHRLSTIEHADRIVVMDQGRIVQQGSHAQLLAEGGLYAQLHQRDFGESPESSQVPLTLEKNGELPAGSQHLAGD